jgi:hypothetical protein
LRPKGFVIITFYVHALRKKSKGQEAENSRSGKLRGSRRIFKITLYIAQGSVEECRYYLILSEDLEYGKIQELEKKLEDVSRLLMAYANAIMKKPRSQVVSIAHRTCELCQRPQDSWLLGFFLSLAGNRFTGTRQQFVLPAGPGLWNVQVSMSLRCQMSRCGRGSRVRIETTFLSKQG